MLLYYKIITLSSQVFLGFIIYYGTPVIFFGIYMLKTGKFSISALFNSPE
jgi:hypothetical protein